MIPEDWTPLTVCHQSLKISNSTSSSYGNSDCNRISEVSQTSERSTRNRNVQDEFCRFVTTIGLEYDSNVMIKVTSRQHDAHLVDILTYAFADNQSVNYVIKQDQKRLLRIRSLMQYARATCQDFGAVWQSEDQKACALTLLPDQKRTTADSVTRDIRLATLATGLANVPKTLSREARIQSYHPSTPFCHLWFIAVEQESQGRGVGSRLLKDIIKHYQALQRPIYLETSTLRNLPWYKKHGFQQYNQLDFSFPLYLLKNEP